MYLYRYSYNTSIRDIRSTKILLQSKNGYINTRFGILPGRKNTTLFTFECWRAFPIEFGRLRKYAHSYDVTRVSLWKMEAQVKIAKQRKRRGEVLTSFIDVINNCAQYIICIFSFRCIRNRTESHEKSP